MRHLRERTSEREIVVLWEMSAAEWLVVAEITCRAVLDKVVDQLLLLTVYRSHRDRDIAHVSDDAISQAIVNNLVNVWRDTVFFLCFLI